MMASLASLWTSYIKLQWKATKCKFNTWSWLQIFYFYFFNLSWNNKRTGFTCLWKMCVQIFCKSPWIKAESPHLIVWFKFQRAGVQKQNRKKNVSLSKAFCSLFQSWRTGSLVQSEIISIFTEEYVFVSVVTKWYNQLSAKAVTKSHHATEQLLTIQYIGSVKELSGGATGSIITRSRFWHCFCELLRKRKNVLSSRCYLFYNVVCAAVMH